jgi:CHAT domain-containing protein/tetratricopeptide (TPR) repeat protein/WD40 repeat protein
VRFFIATVFAVILQLFTIRAEAQNLRFITSSSHNRQVALSFAEPYPLTTHPESDLMPALSPDGKWMAYVSRANKNYDIWVKPAAGGLATPLTTHSSDDFSPAWSPDGKRLAFISRRDDAEGDLYLLELKYGSGTITPGKTRLLKHNLDREAQPVFSPDGEKIAFSLGPSGREQIWLYEIKTQRKYQLTKNGGAQPAWSPDGKRLAITCPTSNAGGNQIFLISADTAEADLHRLQITFDGDNGFPSWSPDGQKILVQRFEGAGRQSHLRIIALAEPRRELQITPSQPAALFPFWGNKNAIYYAADHYGNLDIWRIPEVGLIPVPPSPSEGFAAAQQISDPEMSRLAFAALRFYFPDSTFWLGRADLEIGRRYLSLGDTAKAKAVFAQIARERAGSSEAAFADLELAKLARDKKRFAEISGKSQAWPVVQAFCALETGKALQSEGKLEAALRVFQKIPEQVASGKWQVASCNLPLAPCSACYEASLRSGDILAALDRLELAAASYLQIVTTYLDRQDWRATAINRLLDLAPRRAFTSDTLAAYRRVMQDYAAHPAVARTAHFKFAERLFRDGEIKLAVNEYQSLIALLDNQSDRYLQTLRGQASRQLMRLHLQANEFPAAAQIYQNFFETQSNSPEKSAAQRELTGALIRRAQLLARNQDHEYALALFRQAREYDPKNLEAHRGYVETRHALGDLDEVIAEYEKAHPAFARFAPPARDETAPNETALYGLGLAYSYKGEKNLGLLRHSTALIERALRLDYRMIPAYLTLGFNYEAIENLERKERERPKGFFEKVALAAPNIIDKTRRTLTFRSPRPPARWYEKAIEVLSIAIALNDENSDPQMEARLALNLANNYYHLIEFGFDPEYALQYFQRKLRYDSTFVSPRQQAIIFERLGECAWASRRYDEAASFLQKALSLCRELRDVDGELRTLNRLALVYQSKGEFDTSIEHFAKVDTVSRRENRPENLSLVWRNMAYNHQQNRESDEAIAKSGRAAALLEQRDRSTFPQAKKGKLTVKLFDVLPIFWMSIDPFGESNTEGLTLAQEKSLLLSITGESYVAARDFANAIAVFEQKAKAFRRQKNGAGEARALNNLGLLWYSYHEFDQAYTCFERSFELCDRLNAPAGKIINLINMGNIALLTGKERSLRAVDSLLEISTADIEQISPQAPRQKLAVMNMLGNLYLRAAQRVLENQSDSAAANAGLGDSIERTYRALQNLGRARAAYDTALVVAQTSRLPREEIAVRRNLANLFVLSRDYAPALAQLKTARDICLEKNLSELTWRVEHAIGTVCRFIHLPPEHPLAAKSALEWHLSAIRILEGLPEEPEGSEQRLAATEEQSALYENAVALLSEQQRARAALELSERARGNRFVNLISTRYILPKKERQRLIWGGGGGEALFVQRKVSRLRGELAKLEAEETIRPKEIKSKRDELAAAEAEYQRVVQIALAEDPELASFFSIQNVDTKALQDSLDNETAILNYFVTGDELIVWLISRDRLEQIRVAVTRQRLRMLVLNLRQSWRERRDDSRALGREFSTLVLGRVHGLEAFRRVIIIPDDGLHYLPFGALAYGGESLVDLFAIVKAPSLLALKFAERHRNLNENNLLVLQDAPVAARDSLFWASLGSNGVTIQRLRGADWRAGEARQKFQHAGLVHIQHRFLVQPQRPLDSGFQLCLAAADTARLPLSRLFEFDLSASLVTLENTAFPFALHQNGDEIIALQRSLIYAGAPTIVCPQWPVEAKIRDLFFQTFYKNLSSQPAMAAMNAAQHAVREQFPDPHDWAGFELIGFSGLSAAEKSAFANLYFEETVRKGNEAQELGEFADAARYYQSALAMARQLGQNDAVQNLYLLIKSSAISGHDYATACEIETKILEAALAANDVRQAARSYRNLSIWNAQLKNYAAAAGAEKKYLELAERARNPLAAAESHFQQAKILEAAGLYAEAMKHAQQAAEIFKQHDQIAPRLQAETLLGKLALEDDRYEAALEHLENAAKNFLEIRQPSGAAEQRALATAYQLTGSVYSRLTAYGEALAFHQKALEIFEAIGDTANLALAALNLADAHWLNGDYQEALVHARAALKAARQQREKLRGQSTLGLILLSLGDFDGALDAEKSALLIALETEERREQATIHKNIGLVYVQRRQHQQALASFRQATTLDQQTDFERGLLYDYLFLGQTFQILSQPDSALAYLAKTEKLALKLNDHRAYTKALYTKGLTAIDRNNKSLARASFTEALAKAEEVKLDEMQWRCLWRLGWLARQSGDLTPALDFYLRAIAALERQSAKIKIEEYRSGFIDNKSEIYEEAVLLLLQMNRVAEAFAIAERAKSRSFADLLANGKIDWQAGADRDLLNRRDRLSDRLSLVQGKINSLQQKAGTEASSRLLIAALNDTLSALQKEYSSLLVELKTANPELADMVSVEPLPLAEVQALLPDSARTGSVAMVEYFFAKDRLVCWVVDRRQVRAVVTALDRNKLNESIMQFRRAITKRASTENFSRPLYDQLVKPIELLLQNKTQLVIVPHGVLHYLPFPALQKADSTYLIDHYALALAPSATVFGFCHRKANARGEVSLLNERRENFRVVALGNPDAGNARLDLPFAGKEIKSLAQTFGAIESYERKQATPSALMAGAARANVIHLSCHGVYDERNPLFSALLLAPDSTNQTGRLEAHKIFGLKLNASLVMLSACETGLARVTGGDEVIGLARGFIFAGTPSLIASLWTVDDLATAITVKRFYRYLKSGLSKAQALREAQRFVRDHHNRHPAYWASFGLTGDWR